MVVCLAFQYGPGSPSKLHVALIIKLGPQMVAYCMPGKGRTCGKYLVHHLCTPEMQYHYGVLPMSPEEEDKIVYTCEACAFMKLGQTAWDRLWQGTPFDDTCEQTLFTAKSVRATELIVLVLRTCLDPSNPAFPVVAACSSRTVTPDELRGMLEGCLKSIKFETIQDWAREWDQCYYVEDGQNPRTYKICKKECQNHPKVNSV